MDLKTFLTYLKYKPIWVSKPSDIDDGVQNIEFRRLKNHTASIEIARRAYKKFEKGWIYPKIISDQRIQQVLGNQWKKELMLDYMSWKGLSGIIKKSKLKYRFQLQPLNAVFRHFDLKSNINLYNF